MRKRKRDWPVLMYQYGIRLPGIHTWAHLPEPVREEANALRTLWNTLVDTFMEWQTHYRTTLSQVPVVAEHEAHVAEAERQREQTLAALKSARQRLRRTTHPELTSFQESYDHSQSALREAYAALQAVRRAARAQLAAVLKEQQAAFFTEARRRTRACPAHWSNREFVLNSFLTAVSRALMQQGELRRKVGEPREVHFQHRFTSGGVPVARLFGTRAHVQLEIPPVQQPGQARPRRSHGSIQVAGVPLLFEIRLHRPLPEGAIVKAVALIGREVIGRGLRHGRDGAPRYLLPQWQWSLSISLEVPPETFSSQAREGPVAALDLGYRVWEKGVRIGVLVDSTGHTEALMLPAPLLEGWRYRRSLQEKADCLLEVTKATLRQLPRGDNLPEEAHALVGQLATARAGGLWRLLRLVEHTPGDHLRVLQQWADRSTRLWREARGVERHYMAYRNHLYRAWALHVCQRYRKVAINKLALKRIAEAEEKVPRLREAAKYRQLASVSRLVSNFKHAAVKTGTEVVEVALPTPALACAECGAVIARNTGEVYLSCPNGHRWDQDENRGKILLRTVV